jgi:hypothetical protein
MERDPERNPETRADLNEVPQEEIPAGEPLSPTGSQELPATTQPPADELAAAQAQPRWALRLPKITVEDPEQFLGMLAIQELRDREGHLLLAEGETVTASSLAEIEAADRLEELAGVVRPPLPPVAPLGME